MYGKEPPKTPFHKRRKQPYFARFHGNGQSLAVVVEARDLHEAWCAAGGYCAQGLAVTSVVRLWKNKPGTKVWMKQYATLSPYPNNKE